MVLRCTLPHSSSTVGPSSNCILIAFFAASLLVLGDKVLRQLFRPIYLDPPTLFACRFLCKAIELASPKPLKAPGNRRSSGGGGSGSSIGMLGLVESAARRGYLDLMQWAYRKGYPLGKAACREAAEHVRFS
jgi:hypothetical protein